MSSSAVMQPVIRYRQKRQDPGEGALTRPGDGHTLGNVLKRGDRLVRGNLTCQCHAWFGLTHARK